MTKKKRELIEILLDNVKPEDWPEHLPYAAQDKCDSAIYVYSGIPDITSIYNGCWHPGSLDCEFIKTVDVLCKFWSKIIVTRDEFVKRWNERNMVVDSEGWIQWNDGEIPVENGTLIDVKYKNGEINLHISAGTPLIDNGSISGKYACDWWSSESDWSIVAYRLHAPQQQKTPQQLALEKFGTDWHDNNGSIDSGDNVRVDVKYKCGESDFGVLLHHLCMDIPYSHAGTDAYQIEKWRIHSDEKESQIYEKETALESLCQPMPPCSAEIPCNFVDIESPLSTQIGGDHYTKLAIQPMQYSMKNGIDPLQHTIIKYVTRFRDKAGIEDLEKAKHCIDMLIEFEKEIK